MFVAHLKALARNTNWMAIGDWNLTPDEDDVHCLFPLDHVMHFPREANGFPKSTTWKGSRCIDWCASAPSFCPESIQLDETYWSDHIMLELTVRAQRYDMPALVETLDCSRPGDMPLDDWDTVCAKLWEKDRSTQLVPRRADEIQQCWNNFNKKLKKVLITAGNKSKSGQIRPKGSCLEFKSTKKPHRQRNTQVVTFQERKCRKLLGRLHEALRQGKMRSDEARVFVRSGFTPSSSGKQIDVTRLEQQQSKKALDTWKRKMIQKKSAVAPLPNLWIKSLTGGTLFGKEKPLVCKVRFSIGKDKTLQPSVALERFQTERSPSKSSWREARVSRARWVDGHRNCETPEAIWIDVAAIFNAWVKLRSTPESLRHFETIVYCKERKLENWQGSQPLRPGPLPSTLPGGVCLPLS